MKQRAFSRPQISALMLQCEKEFDGAATEAVAAFSLRLITKKKMKKRKREKSSRQPRGGPFISARKRCVKGSDCASGRIPHGKMIAVDFSDWLPWSAKW
jgi:hypothetical protein